MARNFASLPLARLYEKQGYIDQALEIYKEIDTSRSSEAKSISDTISRLEAQKKTADADCKDNLADHDPLTPDRTGTKEKKMAYMLENWLKLIVMQKRVDIFKNIKSRL